MKPLDARTRQHIIDILTPLIATEGERRALLILALFDYPLLNQLDYTGSAQTFIANLIDKLFHFGKLDDGRPALWAVMETAREQVGLDHKHLIDALRPAFELPPPSRRDRIFISYSRQNEREAQRIVSNLKDAGLRVWYDREKIKGGTEWWASIERGILNADYFVFCLSTASIRSQVARDELLTARRSNKPIFAIMLEDCLSELYDKEFAEQEGFAEIGWLPSLHIINFTQPDRYGDSLRELIQSLPGYALPDGYYLEQIDPRDLPNPFRGLEAFLEVDAPYFAGREDAVQEILTHLRDVSKPRLLAVVGASGSGKSSLVQAGVIPMLRRELPFWETLIIKPGSSPLNELADRLQERLGADSEQTRERLREQLTAIDDIGSELMQGKPDDARFVLIIDQFEELFTLTGDDERQHVLERLLYAVNQPNGRVQILLTMRADFFNSLSTVPELARLVRENLDIATDMTPDQLRRSIERPARQVGVSYEDGLVEQILEDVRSQPGSLPLLQYALKELFERKIGRRMTLEAYDAIKGVKGALATRAEAIYAVLSSAEQDALRRILLRLVEVGEGTVSRRRVVRSDLSFTGIADETVQRVLDRLTASEARLLVASAPVDDNDPSNDGQIFYEVSHEALLTHWERLDAWIAENRGDLRLSSDILTLARVWEGTGRTDTSYLLTGGRLIAAQEWLERGDATSLQQAFVKASIVYRQAEIERLETLRRQAEEATQHAAAATRQAEKATHASEAASKRAVRNRTIAVTVGLIAFIFAVGASLIGANAVNEANNASIREQAAIATVTPIALTLEAGQTQVAGIAPTLNALEEDIRQREQDLLALEGERLAALSENALTANDNPETAALLAIRALNIAYSPVADSVLLRAIDRFYTRTLLRLPFSSSMSEFMTDGIHLIFADDTRVAQINLQTGETRLIYTIPRSGIYDLAASPNGNQLLIGSKRGDIWMVQLSSGQLVWERDSAASGGSPASVVFDVTGEAFAITTRLSAEQRLTDQPDQVIDPGDDSVYAYPGRNRELLVTDSMTAGVRDVITLRPVRSLGARENGFTAGALSASGEMALIGSGNGLVQVWNIAEGGIQFRFTDHTQQITDAAISPDNRYGLTSSADRTVRLWDLQAGTLLRTYTGDLVSVFAVGFAPDGSYAFSISADGMLRLLNLPGGANDRVWLGHQHTILSMTFSLDGATLATGSQDNTVRLWDVASGQSLAVIEGRTDDIESVAFSADGRYLLAGSSYLDGTIVLWDVTTSEMVRSYDWDRTNQEIEFLPDGHSFITASYDAASRLSLETGEVLEDLPGMGDPIAVSAEGTWLVGTMRQGIGSTVNIFQRNSVTQTYELSRSEGLGFIAREIAFVDETTLFIAGGFSGTSSAGFSMSGSAYLYDLNSNKWQLLVEGISGEMVYSPTDGGFVVFVRSAGQFVFNAHIFNGQGVLVRIIPDAGELGAVSPDGRWLVTGYDDGTLRVWDMNYRGTMAYACTRLVRDLTDDERSRYAVDEAATCPTAAS